MDQEQQDFERNLELLIRLFRKIRERGEIPGAMDGMDANMRQSMDFLIRNFEMMKNDPSARESMKNIDNTFRQMLSGIIKNLHEQLGDDADDLFDTDIPKPRVIEPVVNDQSQVDVGLFTRRLVQIDALLAKGNLPDDDIDALLDERIRIIQKLNPGT